MEDRSEIMGRLDRAIEQPTAVVFVDVDRLDSAAGEALLRIVMARLHTTVRSQDAVGRLGGSEFVVVCPDVPDATVALVLAERIAVALAPPARIGDEVVECGARVGVAWSDGSDVGSLVVRLSGE